MQELAAFFAMLRSSNNSFIVWIKTIFVLLWGLLLIFYPLQGARISAWLLVLWSIGAVSELQLILSKPYCNYILGIILLAIVLNCLDDIKFAAILGVGLLCAQIAYERLKSPNWIKKGCGLIIFIFTITFLYKGFYLHWLDLYPSASAALLASSLAIKFHSIPSKVSRLRRLHYYLNGATPHRVTHLS